MGSLLRLLICSDLECGGLPPLSIGTGPPAVKAQASLRTPKGAAASQVAWHCQCQETFPAIRDAGLLGFFKTIPHIARDQPVFILMKFQQKPEPVFDGIAV